MKQALLYIFLFLSFAATAQEDAATIKARIDDSITHITAPRTIKATNVGARMKEVVDFANLRELSSNKSTSTSLGTSNSLFPSQNAVKTYVDNAVTALAASTVSLSGSYANPSWIQSLIWSKITGTPTTISGYGITMIASDIPTGVDAAKLHDGSISNTEFGYLNNVSGNIQTQIDGKLATSSASNGSISKSAAKTTTIPTQNSVERLVNRFASTELGTPYMHWIADTPWVKIGAANVIDSFFDASGNGRHAWQATAGNKATFVASGGMNNQPYANFNSSSPSKYTSGTMTLDTNSSIFMVYRFNEADGGSGEYVLGSAATTAFALTSTFQGFDCGGGQSVLGYGGLYGYCIVEWHRIGRVSNMYINGVKVPISNTLTTNTFNWSGLGANIGSGSQFPALIFHELICYSTRQNEQQIYNIRNYLFSKYGIKSATVVATGDSYTSGSGTIGLIQGRWLTKLSGYLGMAELGQGVAGTVLTSKATSPATNNGYDRRSLMPYANPLGYVVVMYGGNDANASGIGLTDYSPIRYKFQYSTVINELLKKGWRRDQIVIATQPIFNGGNSARWDSFHTAQLEIAREMNVILADLKTRFGTNVATNGAIGGDGTHYTLTQHDTAAIFIRNVIYNGWTQDSVCLVTGSYKWLIPNGLTYVFTGTTSTMTVPPVSGNSGTRITISNRGSGDITLNDFNGSADEIYTTAATSSTTIAAGVSWTLEDDGTYWRVVAKF